MGAIKFCIRMGLRRMPPPLENCSAAYGYVKAITAAARQSKSRQFLDTWANYTYAQNLNSPYFRVPVRVAKLRAHTFLHLAIPILRTVQVSHPVFCSDQVLKTFYALSAH